MEFESFPRMARLTRECVISEKIDGTNAQIAIKPVVPGAERSGDCIATVNELAIFAGSRNRWITPENDNYGFAAWVKANVEELVKLGPGRHFGEWWGAGIQRRYGLQEKRFSLFNVHRWSRNLVTGELIPELPACCHVVPVLGVFEFSTQEIQIVMNTLAATGSYAAPGFMQPEGIVIYHTASKTLFKKTFAHDAQGKPE